MNAKEIDSEEILHKHCNCEFSKQTGEQVVYSTLSSVQMAMESYHQAKSKEEAKERYKVAKYALGCDSSGISLRVTPLVEHALRLAAFGKECDE